MTTTAPASAPAAEPKKAAPRTSPQGSGKLAALLLTPTFLVLGLVIVYPLIAALRESLYRRGEGLDESGFVVEGERFVGVDNYSAIFQGEAGDRFWNAFGNTTWFTVVSVLIEIVIGVAMALVMHHALRGKGLVRASILVPWAIPTAVSAILWRWIFTTDGVANQILNSEVLWTAEGQQAFWAVVIADTWKTAPFIGLLVLAGLQLISGDVYEAARVDGANAWLTFWRITLPLVKPALLVAVLFRTLDVLRMFDLPFVMIGQRKFAVETLSMLAYDEASNLRYGPAAAYATVLFLYVALVAFVFVKLLGADVIGEARSQKRLVKRQDKGEVQPVLPVAVAAGGTPL
ncbi:MAG TPA: sugar ABC transporter permease [Actinophytocola sp.]|uniref:carbohydrate ABC transporter permease n=1 Tax=Actinophytocola sp. TaxID=1872138 RepID=UPI002DB71638|nr:sugar ABC transporter permease [Actinophytocola sp.]HEU5472520.1 sugar ABC transporter permease [Actinophytocola sp.]